jgi:hypothetical protein
MKAKQLLIFAALLLVTALQAKPQFGRDLIFKNN